MGLFNESVEKYDTQTQPLNNPYSIGKSLSGCVYKHLNQEGSDLLNILRDASCNSLVGRLYNLTKNCLKGGKYEHTIGAPEGSFIVKPLTRNIFNNATGFNASSITSYKITMPCEELFIALINDILVKQYQYDGTGVYINNKYYILKEVGIDANRRICAICEYTEQHGYGPNGTPNLVTIQEEIETDVFFNDDLNHLQLLVEYIENQEKKYFIWCTVHEENTILSSWFSSNKVTYYPSFFARRDKQHIKEVDPLYYEDCCRALKRLNLDWEDIVDNFNGVAKVNSKTTYDEDYKDSLKNVTDIALTFALDITVNDQRVMRYLYEFFDYMHSTSGINGNHINYSHKAYNCDISWLEIKKETKKGKIAKFHRYTTQGVKESRLEDRSMGQYTTTIMVEYYSLIIQRQLDNNEYIEITVSGLTFDSYNNGKRMRRTCPVFSNLEPYDKTKIKELQEEDVDEEDKNECLVPVLPIIIKKLGGITGGDVLGIAMRSVHNTYVKIKKKWYQTTFFTVIRIVIYIIYIIYTTIYTGGTGTAPAIKSAITIEALIQLLVVLAIKIAVKIICKVFKMNPETCAIIDTVVDIFCTYVLPNMTSTPATQVSGQTMQIGSTAVDVGASIGGTMVSTLTSSLITSMCTALVNRQFNLNTFANMLGSVAVMNTMIQAPVSGALLDLTTNPQFYYNIQTKNWCGSMTSIANTVLKAVASQQVTNKKVDSLYESLLKQLNSDNILSIGSAYTQGKEQKYQNRLVELNKGMLSLGRLIQSSQDQWSSVLSANNSIILGLIIDQLNQSPEYNFYKIASTIKTDLSV